MRTSMRFIRGALAGLTSGTGRGNFIVLSVLFLFCMPLFAAGHDTAPTTKTWYVHMSEKGFEPKRLVIEKGGTVIFETTGREEHWPASNLHPTHTVYPNTDIEQCGKALMFDACRSIKPGESFSFTFEHSGVWKYHDHLDPSLSGTIEVAGASVGTAAPEEKVSFWKRLALKYKRWRLKKDTSSIFKHNEDLSLYIDKYGIDRTIHRLDELRGTHGDCHQRAHTVGRMGYEKKGQKIFGECPPECMSGCYHGAIEAFFSKNGTYDLAENFNKACDIAPSGFFRLQCFHGIGHGLMAWTNYELFEALDSCDTLKEEAREDCYRGVFMENITGGNAKEKAGVIDPTGIVPAHATEYLSEDPLFPCSIVSARHKSPCFLLQSTRMVQLHGRDFKTISALCEKAGPYAGRCFEGMGNDIESAFEKDRTPGVKLCGEAPEAFRKDCIVGLAKALFWDKGEASNALHFCASIEEQPLRTSCERTIADRGKDLLAKKELAAFCKELGTQSVCSQN